MHRKKYFFLLLATTLMGCSDPAATLENNQLQITWADHSDGWKIDKLSIRENENWKSISMPSGEYTLLYSANKPDSVSKSFKTITGVDFPEPVYKYQIGHWQRATSPVSLNIAGEAFHFYPSVRSGDKNEINFTHELSVATISSSWKLDPQYPSDIIVSQTLIARKDGYYSLATPTLADIKNEAVTWATVPGYFQGNAFNENCVLAYAYGQGLPKLPVIYTERCASTLAPTVSINSGVSLSVAPHPGLARDPWEGDKNTHEESRIGLSHMNRRGNIFPTVYYPVLGQQRSKMKAGDSIRYEFRYTLNSGGWLQNLTHVANDIYKFKETLALRSNKRSLTSRVEDMHHYLTNGKTSLWNVESFKGLKIGGQSYLGGVVGSHGDAMKNSDYGAMWMLARATDDPVLKKNVLPYALNFKLAQQQTAPGFFHGAAMGQYYLAKRKVFVEEWGEFVEPISLTYYTMLDVGNILLFEPNNKLLLERLRIGAELLLKWQKQDGSWEVAYDQATQQPLFKDIEDLRPTFYGLVVAYRILKDEKYLKAAEKGAEWLIRNGVEKGHFLGVCGDARYVPDFATAQTAQVLLDLYDITRKQLYKEAAIATARIYATSIYTHPVPDRRQKKVHGVTREDWEISQAGLGFEHGGIIGSAQRNGPILLASHAGLFLRIFKLSGDSLLIDMARAGAIGRDAFVDSTTHVASYYWNAMNKGAGPYPHHAWWQIGWITDYLMAEAQLRSNDRIVFPRGFVTPKVGPHQSYGFEPGKIFDEPANLIIRDGLLKVSDPNIEYITALSVSGNRLFAVVLNDRSQSVRDSLQIGIAMLRPGAKVKGISELMENKTLTPGIPIAVALPPYGISVYAIDF